MKTTTLYIKNMVCPRCIKTVEEEIKKIGFKVKHIELGKVEVREQIGTETIKKIDKVLTENGFKFFKDLKKDSLK